MLKLFEKSTLFQVVVILLVTILLWLPLLADPQPLTTPDGFAPLYSLLYNLSLSPLLSVIIAIVIIIVGGILLNLMLAKHLRSHCATAPYMRETRLQKPSLLLSD